MLKILREFLIIKKSNLFDPCYYLAQYPDVRRADIDPVLHFVRSGWKEGRNPSQNFNTNYYLKSNPDVNNSHINPLLHYIRFGKIEGRLTLPENYRMQSFYIGSHEGKKGIQFSIEIDRKYARFEELKFTIY